MSEGPHARFKRPVNRPELEALSYRVGTYDAFVQQMLDRLVVGLQTGFREGTEEAEDKLKRVIRINKADDWLVALVKSWATVADVLTFYQERIIQEGYLRTAVEDRSVHELVRMIGDRPGPGVAGSADLAISVTRVKGLPDEIEMPSRLVVRSVPPPGAEPQTFETTEGLRARASWNLLIPPLQSIEQTPELTGAATGAQLLGTGNGLAVGSAILVLGVLAGQPVRIVRLLTGVKIQPGSPPYTEAAWGVPLAADLPQETIRELELLVFRQQHGLFGQNAPVWGELPPETRQQVQTIDGGVLLSGDAGWEPRNRGLPSTAVIQCLAVDADGNLFAGTAGDGIYRSVDGGATWKASRRGLQQLDVQTVIPGPHGVLFAGTPAGGVYRSTDQGEIWEVTSAPVMALPRRGLLRSKKAQPGPLPATTVRTLATVRWGDVAMLFAGTDSGVFRSADAGRSWLASNQGLPGTDPDTGLTDVVVCALAPLPDKNLIYAGTARGVFESTNGGRLWHPVNRGIPATDPFSGVSLTPVRLLAAYRDRQHGTLNLFAGTARGLFRSTDGGDHWQRAVFPALPGVPAAAAGVPAEVLSLAVLDDKAALVTRIYAGLPDGLWSSIDHGVTWSPVYLGDTRRVIAVAGRPDGAAVVATPFTGFSRDWPDFRIRGNQIDLDGIVPNLAAGSWIALRPGEASGAATVGVYRIRRVYTVLRRDFLLAATVTRVEVADPDPLLASFDLRQTRVYVQSEALGLRPRLTSAVTGAVGLLRAELLTLGSRKVIVMGRTLPAAFAEVAEPANALGGKLGRLRDQLSEVNPGSEVTVRLWLGARGDRLPDIQVLMSASKLQELLSAHIAQTQSDNALGMPQPSAGDAASGAGRLAATLSSPKLWNSTLLVTLAVTVAGGLTGMTLLAADLAASLDAPENVSPPGDEHPIYAVRIPWPGPGRPPLVLDAATLQVHGNVVAATEGVTVREEVLGHGDAAAANQSFALAQPPAFERGPGRPRSTLAVYVQAQRQLWEEVDWLHRRDGKSRVYRVDLDERGRARLIFGDGTSGALLPSGRDNVVATYRTGMSARTVEAGGLSLLATRPLGLDAVTNPLPSTPGAKAESREEIRFRAPRLLYALGRIVSLRDFEDFALEQPGVEKAGAWEILAGGRRIVQITLSAGGGAPIPEGSALITNLLDAIQRNRAFDSPVTVQSYRPVRVLVAARLQVMPGHLWDDVRKDVQAALADEFDLARARFGGTISAAAVVSAMQRVRGVRSVDLESFSWVGRSDGDGGGGDGEPRERRAAPPFWDPVRREIVPAELLRLDPPSLTWVRTP